MIKLADYFAPLNFYTIPIYLGLLMFFDVLGSFVKPWLIRDSKTREQSRIINWLIGLGFFIFIWFILRFFIPPQRSYLLISIVGFLLLSLPSYLKKKRYKKLLEELWHNKIVLLIIAPLLPALFVKASLPPYYADEMAYHLISPSSLQAIKTWDFHGGLFANVPHLMNFFYTITFSIARTFSVTRLINFSILATSMLYAHSVLKRNFGFLSGLLFVFIFFSLPQGIIFTSTLGYVDVPTYSFLLIGLMSALDYLVRRKKPMLVIAIIFGSLALGTKYTPITAISSFALIYSAVVIFRRKYYKNILNPKFAIRLLAMFILFGGYWYVKNYVVYGNPIYPFLFQCKSPYVADCVKGSSFFGDWTLPVTFNNLYPILQSLLPKNIILHLSLVFIPILQLMNKNKKTRILSIALLGGFIGELFILSMFSGFMIRYHQHMQFFLIAALVIQLANSYDFDKIYLIQKGVFFMLTISAISSYVYVIKHTNSLKFLNWNEINYSIGRIDIYDWIDWKFPKMKNTIIWCESPTNGEPTPLARFDPDLIWYTHAGKMRSFTTNCYYKNPLLYGENPEAVVETAINKELTFWISSNSKCLPRNEVKRNRESEDDEKFRLRRLSNEIVCNSEEVLPYLYRFDYKNIETDGKNN